MNHKLIAVVAAGLVVCALVVTSLSIDRVVMRAIERYGSEALGTEVSVADVEIRLADGHGRISGLRVAQPEGWGSGEALVLGEIVLDLDVASLTTGEPYVLEVVRVTDPVAHYVLREDGTSNFDVIQQHLARGREPKASPRTSETNSPERDDALRLRIDRLEVEGGRIVADVRAASIGEQETKLPPLRIARVGDEQGLPPDDLAKHVGGRLVAHSIAAVTASSFGHLVKRGGRELRGLLDRLIP